MPTDQLILGGIVFDDWSTPERAPYGGDQCLKVHKLPGGSRVIDVLGPDERDIELKGILWGADAEGRANALNDMRIAGSPVALSFGGNFFMVLVKTFEPEIRRYPVWYEYRLVCVVASNPMAGNLTASASSFANLVSADLATALSIAGL